MERCRERPIGLPRPVTRSASRGDAEHHVVVACGPHSHDSGRATDRVGRHPGTQYACDRGGPARIPRRPPLAPAGRRPALALSRDPRAAARGLVRPRLTAYALACGGARLGRRRRLGRPLLPRVLPVRRPAHGRPARRRLAPARRPPLRGAARPRLRGARGRHRRRGAAHRSRERARRSPRRRITWRSSRPAWWPSSATRSARSRSSSSRSRRSGDGRSRTP